MKKKLWLLPLLLNLSCQSSGDLKTEPSPSQISLGGSWKGSMQSLRISISNLVPYIFNETRFEAPANSVFLEKEIHNLSLEAAKLNHDATLVSRDPTVHFVSQEFSEQLKTIESAFKAGKKSFARYELMRTTNHCVDCHTRTQQGSEFNFRMSEPFPKDMSSLDKIEYLVASRNFKKAFTESLIALNNPSVSASHLEKTVFLGLQVAVQYQNDSAKAKELIQALEKNKDISYMLKEKAKIWRKSLASWKNEKVNLTGLELARVLMNKKVISEIEAMRSLHGLIPLFMKDLKSEDLGEALFLAGQAYEILGESSPLNLHENYYESCIRRVPHSTWSQRCYDKLQNSIVLGYSGSSGINIPIDVQVKIEELRKQAEKN